MRRSSLIILSIVALVTQGACREFEKRAPESAPAQTARADPGSVPDGDTPPEPVEARIGHSAPPSAPPTRDRASEPPPPVLEQTQFELLPGIWIDPARCTVEFDAEIAADCHNPETPLVYLEVICCTPDTREHEALVVTRAPPSAVHAALLALDALPGRPGGWRTGADGVTSGTPALGQSLEVTFLLDRNGSEGVEDPGTWIVDHHTTRTLRETYPESGWVFAGSRTRIFRDAEVYDADYTGQLVGLHTFGSETIAWTRTEHHDAGVHPPQWLAANERVPTMGTPVRVRIRVLQEVGDDPGVQP